jgi:hypothetical protein
MTYEISNAVLFDLFRDRDRRRMETIKRISRSIVWPARERISFPPLPVTTPDIPLREYVGKVFADADAADKSLEEYVRELNAQRRKRTPDFDEVKGWTKMFKELQKLRNAQRSV